MDTTLASLDGAPKIDCSDETAVQILADGLCSFALLRPITDAHAQEGVRDLVLQAYAEYEEAARQAAS